MASLLMDAIVRKGVHAMPNTASTNELYICRHGRTAYNSDNQISQDLIRGWLDIPLTNEGKKEASEIGKYLSFRGLDGLYTSDLSRAVETAQIISHLTRAPIFQITQSLRPWNLGNFQGKPSKLAVGVMTDYLRYPNLSVPGGESFNTFKNRALGFVRTCFNALRAGTFGQMGLVTHYRVLKLIESWVAAGLHNDIDEKVFLKNNINTGSIDLVKWADGHWNMRHVDVS